MIEQLLIFGATGDLAERFLLPALAQLSAAGHLPDGFHVMARRSGTGMSTPFDGMRLTSCSSTPPRCRPTYARRWCNSWA
jgi:hypothetical protein